MLRKCYRQPRTYYGRCVEHKGPDELIRHQRNRQEVLNTKKEHPEFSWTRGSKHERTADRNLPVWCTTRTEKAIRMQNGSNGKMMLYAMLKDCHQDRCRQCRRENRLG